MSWPEVVITVLKLVDGDRIGDLSGHSVPLVDFPVCKPSQTISSCDLWFLWQGWIEKVSCSGPCGSPNSLRWCSWWVWTAWLGHHVDGAYGWRLILGRIRNADFWCGVPVWWLPSAPSPGFWRLTYWEGTRQLRHIGAWHRRSRGFCRCRESNF